MTGRKSSLNKLINQNLDAVILKEQLEFTLQAQKNFIAKFNIVLKKRKYNVIKSIDKNITTTKLNKVFQNGQDKTKIISMKFSKPGKKHLSNCMFPSEMASHFFFKLIINSKQQLAKTKFNKIIFPKDKSAQERQYYHQ